ncbi:MAG: DUF4920 domain-containing protein [Bacteroidota bacterium]|nr:DUF4920 domain-containing protein [Bacteroidota bacterium]
MLNLFKRITLFAFAIILISSVSYSQDDTKSHDDMKKKETDGHSTDEPAGIKMSDGVLYGKDFDPSMTVIEFGDLMTAIQDNDGKTILVKGNVTEVCQAMGCWMIMSEGKNNVRVKTGHNFFLPKDIAGSNAVVIGTFKSTKISEEEAKHYNEETKNPTVKTENISGPQNAYEIEAMGIKILYPVSESGNE